MFAIATAAERDTAKPTTPPVSVNVQRRLAARLKFGQDPLWVTAYDERRLVQLEKRLQSETDGFCSLSDATGVDEPPVEQPEEVTPTPSQAASQSILERGGPGGLTRDVERPLSSNNTDATTVDEPPGACDEEEVADVWAVGLTDRGGERWRMRCGCEGNGCWGCWCCNPHRRSCWRPMRFAARHTRA